MVFAIVCLTNVAFAKPKLFSIQSRIIGGSDALPDQYKYMVRVLNGKIHLGNGAIISERRILTSATEIENFVKDPEKLKIILGSSSFDKLTGGNMIETSILRIILHPNFYKKYFLNDIAILRTVEKIIFNNIIHPIALPTHDLTIQNGLEAVVTGYGSLEVRN